VVSDRISRLSEFGAACEASLLLFDGCHFPVICSGHMSYSAFLALQGKWNQV
jgi:hypothetical protein